MNRARELLDRALDHLCELNAVVDFELKKEIREFLASEESEKNATTDPVVSSKMEHTFIRLTRDEIRTAWAECDDVVIFVREIERLLEEKNKCYIKS